VSGTLQDLQPRLLFSSNPGRIIREIGVDLKQPRNRLDPQFRDLVEKIYVAMTARTPMPPKIGAAAGTVATSIDIRLPRVSGGRPFFDDNTIRPITITGNFGMSCC
jgi:hypothetical protein